MRKILILLVAFAVIGTAAFADGKFTAWNYGLAFLYAQNGSSTAMAGWGPNWDGTNGNIAGTDNEWSFGYDGKGYGFNATIEFGLTTNAGGQTALALGSNSWQWWGAYFKPFGDVVKITLGAPRIDYVQGTFIEGYYAYNRFIEGGEMSVTAEIKPMAGLTIGVADFIPAGVVASTTPKVASVNMGDYASGQTLDIGNNFGLLASYTVDKLGTFTAQYKREDTTNAGAATLSKLGIGVGINAIQNVGVTAAVGYDLIASLMHASASAKVTLAPVQVLADVAFAQVSSSVSSFAFEVQGEYDMGTMGVGITTGYDDGAGVGLMGEYASAAWGGFELYPYWIANFDNGSFFKVGFLYASGAGTGSVSQSVIAIPITYQWAF